MSPAKPGRESRKVTKPKRRGVPRRLLLKFRVRPLVRMPKSELFRKLRHMVRTGEVPDDVDVAYVEYGHGTGRSFKAGERLTPDEMGQFEQFYNVLTSIGAGSVTAERAAPVRFERPDV